MLYISFFMGVGEGIFSVGSPVLRRKLPQGEQYQSSRHFRLCWMQGLWPVHTWIPSPICHSVVGDILSWPPQASVMTPYWNAPRRHTFWPLLDTRDPRDRRDHPQNWLQGTLLRVGSVQSMAASTLCWACSSLMFHCCLVWAWFVMAKMKRSLGTLKRNVISSGRLLLMRAIGFARNLNFLILRQSFKIP